MTYSIANALGQNQWVAQQTPWGWGAKGFAESLPHLVDKNGSPRSNALKVIGGSIIAGLLGHMAQGDASERNAELFGAMREFRGATPERQDEMARTIPRFGNIALALSGQQNDADLSLDLKRQEAQIMMPLELERFKQQEAIRHQNNMDLWGMRTSNRSGGGMGGMPNFDEIEGMAFGSTGAGEDGIREDLIEFIPQKPGDFTRTEALKNIASGMTPGAAGAAAAQTAKAVYGNVANMRAEINDKLNTAREIEMQYNRMDNAFKKMGNETPISMAFQPLRRVGAAIGISERDSEALKGLKEFNAAATEVAAKGLKQLGSQPTDADLKISLDKVGVITDRTSSEEAKAIISSAKVINEINNSYLREKSNWIEKYKTDQGFEQLWDRYRNENRYYSSDGQLLQAKPPSFSKWMRMSSASQMTEQPQQFVPQSGVGQVLGGAQPEGEIRTLPDGRQVRIIPTEGEIRTLPDGRQVRIIPSR